MSTRSALAYIPKANEPTKWEGIYCHSDGYPTARGKQIWDILHKDFINNKGEAGVSNAGDPKNAIRAFIDIYIKGHQSGFSSFPDECYCHNPAFVIREEIRKANVTSDNPNPLFIEWVYILDEEDCTLTILTGKNNPKAKKDGEIKNEPVKLENGYWNYGHCQYKHIEVAKIDLLGEEPNWEEIERKG